MENIKTLEAACEAAEIKFSNVARLRCLLLDCCPTEEIYTAMEAVFSDVVTELDELTDRLHDLKK